MSPRIVDVDARREQISRAAIQVFARNGFQRALISDIAAEAGLSKGSIYRYFDDKEGLFHAAFQAVQQQLSCECERAIATRDGAWERLSAAVTASVATLCHHIAIFPLTLEFWAAASAGSTRERLGSVMTEMYRAFRRLVVELLQQGVAEGNLRQDTDAEATAAWVVGSLDGLMLQYWFDPNLDPQASAQDMLSILHQGVAKSPDR